MTTPPEQEPGFLELERFKRGTTIGLEFVLRPVMAGDVGQSPARSTQKFKSIQEREIFIEVTNMKFLYEQRIADLIGALRAQTELLASGEIVIENKHYSGIDLPKAILDGVARRMEGN